MTAWLYVARANSWRLACFSWRFWFFFYFTLRTCSLKGVVEDSRSGAYFGFGMSGEFGWNVSSFSCSNTSMRTHFVPLIQCRSGVNFDGTAVRLLRFRSFQHRSLLSCLTLITWRNQESPIHYNSTNWWAFNSIWIVLIPCGFQSVWCRTFVLERDGLQTSGEIWQESLSGLVNFMSFGTNRTSRTFEDVSFFIWLHWSAITFAALIDSHVTLA